MRLSPPHPKRARMPQGDLQGLGPAFGGENRFATMFRPVATRSAMQPNLDCEQ